MSNNRPYRATYVGATRTVHYDYATKEARGLLEGDEELYAGAHRGRDGEKRFSTVTSRKPLKPGTPVCWVNVYAANSEPEHLHAHASKSAADAMASPGRLHCIPVYLPGEGEESAESRLAKQRAEYMEHISEWRYTAGVRQREVEELTARATDAYAEVERLTKELAAAKELTDDRIKEHRNQAFAAGQRMALADVRRALGIKEES